MSPRSVSNSKLPGSSSSVSLNESPTDEINYDSDISEDDHAIAEGDDDEYDDGDEDDDGGVEEEEPDEGFAVEVNTLTGNTFSIMIHPSDTVEVLKTRIAFQEGISPADQNLLLEQGKLLDNTTGGNDNATLQELNIDRNSKLTLVTNVASGVPFKTPPVIPPGVLDNNNDDILGYGNLNDPPLSSSSPSYKLAPTIKRNYNNSNGNQHAKHSTTSSSSSSSLHLPKILSMNHNGNSLYHKDKNSNVVSGSGGSTSNSSGVGGTINKTNVQTDSQKPQQRAPRLDEREWMKSLFNKVAYQNEDEDSMLDHIINDESGGGGDSPAKIVIDIDSTSAATGNDSLLPPRISTRYVGTKYTPEEDGSLLVVQGDDGVILIIQKNTGQLLEKTYIGDRNNNKGKSFCEKVGNTDGRMGRMGRYTRSTTETTMGDLTSSLSTTSYHRSRYQEDNRLVNEKIRENAVTLEKMRQVRGLMAQQKRDRDQNRGRVSGSQKAEGLGVKGDSIGKALEFPKISEGSGGNGIKPLGVRNGAPIGYRGSKTVAGAAVTRKKSGGGSRTLRSVNSSKMSLNRLIAEIYLQSKRKDRHAFQPGQPPYTDQQLLRYVHLKTAIVLDEQKRNKTEPCMKCQLDENWSFNEAGPYIIPTVVMNRYKRLTNGRNSKSLDKEEGNDDETLKVTDAQRRKSMIPVVVPAAKPINPNGFKYPSTNKDGRDSFIPRLILVNRERNGGSGGGQPNNPSSVATTTSTVSRRSSSSMTIKISGNGIQCLGNSTIEGAGTADRDNARTNACHTKVLYPDKDEDYDELVPDDDDNEGVCDSIIITSNVTSNGRIVGSRPTYRVHPKIYSASSGLGGKLSSSRPGSSSKAGAAKKPAAVRCHTCKKKIGIACRYQCRCGLTFCSIHRYPEAHECTFDYKTDGRNKLRENNPVIVAQKIQEI